MKQTVKFSPGSIAAVLFVQLNGCASTMWIYISESKNPESTVMLWHELPEEVQREITMHFTKVFSLCYDARSEYMKSVKPWEIQINQ